MASTSTNENLITAVMLLVRLMKSLTTEGTFMIRESKERGQQVRFNNLVILIASDSAEHFPGNCSLGPRVKITDELLVLPSKLIYAKRSKT